jgi:hypothetical protein
MMQYGFVLSLYSFVQVSVGIVAANSTPAPLSRLGEILPNIARNFASIDAES